MKIGNIIIIVLIICGVIQLYGCQNDEKSPIKCTTIIIDPLSFSDREIEDAMECVKQSFSDFYDNSKLEKMEYSEKIQGTELMNGGSDNAMVIVSTISIEGDVSKDYYCILVKNEKGKWDVQSWNLKN